MNGTSKHPRIFTEVSDLIDKGHKVHIFGPSHIRLNNVVDVYLDSKKWFHVVQRISGDYDTLDTLANKFPLYG